MQTSLVKLSLAALALVTLASSPTISADIDMCYGKGRQRDKCECNLARSINTRETMKYFRLHFNSHGTLCEAKQFEGGSRSENPPSKPTSPPTNPPKGSGGVPPEAQGT
jgi:hypothetical protein